MESGISVSGNGAYAADVYNQGRVKIRVEGDGTLSWKHAREFAELVLSAASRAQRTEAIWAQDAKP